MSRLQIKARTRKTSLVLVRTTMAKRKKKRSELTLLTWKKKEEALTGRQSFNKS